MADAMVYLVPYMDGNWVGYDPLTAEVGYLLEPVVADQVLGNLETALDVMGRSVGGRFVFGVHTGVYCRELFFRDAALVRYHRLVAGQGELALHPHEEVVARGPLVTAEHHMRKIVVDKTHELRKAGLEPTAYRGGYYAYSALLTPILEELGILVDLSAAPGLEVSAWNAAWDQAPPSGYYLCSRDPAHAGCRDAPSRVFEVPKGWDGRGTDLARNYLYNERTSLDDMKRVWEAILARAEADGPQFVYFLCHLHAMGDDQLRARCAGFLEHAVRHGGRAVTPSVAKSAYDGLVAAGA